MPAWMDKKAAWGAKCRNPKTSHLLIFMGNEGGWIPARSTVASAASGNEGMTTFPEVQGCAAAAGASNTVAASSREQGDREGNTQAANYRGAVASALAEKEHLVNAAAEMKAVALVQKRQNLELTATIKKAECAQQREKDKTKTLKASFVQQQSQLREKCEKVSKRLKETHTERQPSRKLLQRTPRQPEVKQIRPRRRW